MVGEKGVHHIGVFLWLARTRGVDESAAGPDDARSMRHHGELFRRKPFQVERLTPPAYFRIAPNGAEAGTGGIDEHTVEDRLERWLTEIQPDDTNPRRARPFKRPAEQLYSRRPKVARNQSPGLAHGGSRGRSSCLLARRKRPARALRAEPLSALPPTDWPRPGPRTDPAPAVAFESGSRPARSAHRWRTVLARFARRTRLVAEQVPRSWSGADWRAA